MLDRPLLHLPTAHRPRQAAAPTPTTTRVIPTKALLGVAETEGTLAFYRDPKVVPGHEDEEKQQSVGTTTMDWMQVIQGEAATLPAKWQRIMLLTD